MSCACGHDHGPRPALEETGEPIELDRPMIALSGRLICADPSQMMLAMDLLPGHIEASRAEPGNLRFDIHQDDDPLVWHLSELFADADAFAAHQARTKDSDWGRDSGDIRRDFHKAEAAPFLRPEDRADRHGIHALNHLAFGSEDEARLVDRLREDGDLDLSLVAAQGGTVLGHIALSRVEAHFPALALAPVAVHPAMQRRGIGSALIRAAIAARPDHAIIVLGEPAYYARFGFAPVDLDSPYAAPALQATGPGIETGAQIVHAPAFASLG
ncbi:GNAT family N-acetyltransferase [Paracoccus sp. TK19116]|uniref:GNAT family N-acetyltransferase n=1 Tax=Paracoccus albicereus TaxID=2922394 RepID=A0ABT1MU50_9RHOB|nr:GNAT family N-acetyltransferase [Paracoccus albicereus]MCQ0971726.1 GNAT family N-acetyltransferase [Paracoccus albicereus]